MNIYLSFKISYVIRENKKQVEKTYAQGKLICHTFFVSLYALITPCSAHRRRAAMRRGWTVRIISFRASGRLTALTTNALNLSWAAPSTATMELYPTSSTDGHRIAKRLLDCNTNLFTAGEHAMMVGDPKRWLLYNPTPSP